MNKQNHPSDTGADANKKPNGAKRCAVGCTCGRHKKRSGAKTLKAQTRTRVRQMEFIRLLKLSGGIHQPALNELGINRCTLKDWRDKDDDFNELMNDVKHEQIDFVRTKMMKGINNGSERLIEFYLSRVDPAFAKPITAPDDAAVVKLQPPSVVFIPASKTPPSK
tara:strand:+ start:10128 stop:10622 length:495 start_codon:yes stop_codon:yes gene_type:complete